MRSQVHQRKAMSGRKRGRPTILEKHDLTKDDLVELYRKYRTIERLSKETGISIRSLKTYLADVPKNHVRTKRTYTFARWLKEHPGQKLPKKISKVSELTGIPRRTIYYYLSAKRRSYQKHIEYEIMKLISNENVIRDYKQRPIPTKGIKYIHVPKVKFFEKRIPVFIEMNNGDMRKIIWEE